MRFLIFILTSFSLLGCNTNPGIAPSNRIPAESRSEKAFGPPSNPNLSGLASQLCRIVDISQDTKVSKESCSKRFNNLYKSSFEKNTPPIQWQDVVTIVCETIPLRDNKESYDYARRSCLRNAFHTRVAPNHEIRSKSCDQMESPRYGGDCYKMLILKEFGSPMDTEESVIEK